MKATTRTTDGLRSTLFDTLDKFMCGEVDHIHAKTVAKLSDSILKSAALDLEHKRFLRDVINETTDQKAIEDMNLNLVLCKSEVNE